MPQANGGEPHAHAVAQANGRLEPAAPPLPSHDVRSFPPVAPANADGDAAGHEKLQRMRDRLQALSGAWNSAARA